LGFSQKRGDSPRVLHFKNQQSSLDNHQSTPCAPQRVSGCLKVVKNAGTVPGYSVKMKGSLVNTVIYYKPNRDHLSKRQKIEALGSARA
jgi:hypothetical protein